ncbi:hypothetical protein B0H11DRAFT_1940394 [Mycena galericulata]|nr:hypothetical protein B0H11DRAFT_1940394 [Mycena galericulata]
MSWLWLGLKAMALAGLEWLWLAEIPGQAKIIGLGLPWPGFGLSHGFSSSLYLHENEALNSGTTDGITSMESRGSRSLGFLAWLWPKRGSGQAKSHTRPRFWLGFGLGTKA